MKGAFEGKIRMAIRNTCPFCGVSRLLGVDTADFDNWQAGMLVQDAFPSASADDREFLMTGICNDCFPKED